MRVAVDGYHAAQAVGGVARYIRGLVVGLARAAPADEFHLFSNWFRPLSASWNPGLPNVATHDVRAPRRLLQACWTHLAWPPLEAFIGPLDIVHGIHFVLPAVRRARCVLTVHDLTFVKHPEYFADRALNERGYRKELPRSLSRADVVITGTRRTRDDLAEALQYPERRIRVIPFGIEEHFFVSADSPRLAAVKARYGLDGPYLVFVVGAPEPRKNLRRTVAAARRAAPAVPLVVVGREAALRDLLGGDTDGVRLPGVVPDADLPYVLNGAALALYPSLYEGFGFPAVEAMAAGVPLITSDRGALPEVVGDAAELVDPECEEAITEAIRRLLDDGARRQDLIERGRTRARELSWPATARQVLQLYRELL